MELRYMGHGNKCRHTEEADFLQSGHFVEARVLGPVLDHVVGNVEDFQFFQGLHAFELVNEIVGYPELFQSVARRFDADQGLDVVPAKC